MEVATRWYKTEALFYALFGKEKKVLVPFGCFASVLKVEDLKIKLLLVHHNYGQKLWSLPGGGLAYIGEPSDKAAERETLEESGLKVEATKLFALLSLTKSVGQVALFGARTSGVNSGIQLSHLNEIDGAGFFSLEEIYEMRKYGEIYKAQFKLARLAFMDPKETVYEWPKDAE